jgi:hypothetical protein
LLGDNVNVFMANASRGAKLLDVRCPGWFERINTETLDMPDGYHCILGQLYAGYWNGVKILGFDSHNCQAVAHGFTLPYKSMASDEDVSEEWALLDLAWILLINDRRAEDAEFCTPHVPGVPCVFCPDPTDVAGSEYGVN